MSTTPVPVPASAGKVNNFLLIGNAVLEELEKIPVAGLFAAEAAPQVAQVAYLIQIYQAAVAAVKAQSGQGINLALLHTEAPVT